MQQRFSLNIIIKLAFLLLFVFALYFQIAYHESLDVLSAQFLNLYHSIDKGLLLLVACLMPLNWLLESLKWQKLNNKFEQLSLSKTYMAILSGLSFSLFTPNRLGEYIGRVLFLAPENRGKGSVSVFINSIAQMIITTILGFIGLYYWVYPLKGNLFMFLIIPLSLIILLILYLYYNIKSLHRFFGSFSFFRKIEGFTTILNAFSYNNLTYILVLSLLRYMVYMIQYLLLLYVYGMKFEIFKAMTLISLIFLGQTIIPSITLGELGIRENLSVYFLSTITDNKIAILVASFSLWMINLILPAIIGSIFSMKINIMKDK